jgi:hypothetical protein
MSVAAARSPTRADETSTSKIVLVGGVGRMIQLPRSNLRNILRP